MQKIEPIIAHHADGAISLTFPSSPEVFASSFAAEDYLDRRGFSVGRRQGPDPRGIILGDFDIQKWRNLAHRDREALDGQMTGNGRTGPVTISIFARARGEAKRAIVSNRCLSPPRDPVTAAFQLGADAAAIATLLIVIGAIVYVGWHPIWARLQATAVAELGAKHTNRAGPIGMRAAAIDAGVR